MKPTPAIVQPAIDLAAIVHEWDMIDSREQRSMAEFRAAKAKILIKARASFNARGDGFVDFVEKKLRLNFDTALKWMKAAGYVPPKKAGAGAQESNHRKNSDDSKGDTTSKTGPAEMPKDASPSVAMTPVSDPPQKDDDKSTDEVVDALERLSRAATAFVTAATHLSGVMAKHGATVGGFGATKIRLGILQAQSQLSQSLSLLKGEGE